MAGRGRYKFKDIDDDNIIQWKEEGKSWDKIAKLLCSVLVFDHVASMVVWSAISC